MKLSYNAVPLDTLGVLQILGQTTVREPVEAPQRERVTYRVRLDFTQNTFEDNYGQIEAVRAALKTQQAVLLWTDATGNDLINRTVTAGEDEEPGDGRRLAGTRRQALTFSFWFYNHDVVTNCLNASFQRNLSSAQGVNPAAPLLDMGAVELWGEHVDAEYFDKLRDPRRLVTGRLTASGRYQGDTLADLATRQAALLARKDKLMAELTAGSSFTIIYGTFNQPVRVGAFEAKVNQPMNYIEWTLSGTFTRYPNEANYLICEYKLVTDILPAEGTVRLLLNGKILAPTALLARAKLAALVGSLVPAGYLQELNKTDEATVSSASAPAPPGGAPISSGDGAAFLELTFELTFRDLTTLVCSYTRTGANTQLQNLGVVDKFSDRYSADLFNPMRDQRKRAGGLANASGHLFMSDLLSVPQKQALLTAAYAAMMTELKKGSSGTLVYGGIFNQLCRVAEFNAEIDRLQNCITWNLSVTYTKFPDEADYALVEFSVVTRENKVDGSVSVLFSGRIGAPTLEAAQAKLTRLRTACVPTGYVTMATEASDTEVDVESDFNSPGGDVGDGQTFIEMPFSEEYRLTAGYVVDYKLKVSDEDDTKSGYIRTTYSGSVQAYGADIPTAWTTALARAEALGLGIYPFMTRSDVTHNENLFLTRGGNVFVTVDFNYEYFRKGVRIYAELTAELSAETFGQVTENVSGHIMAPTLAAAGAWYQTNVRALYTGVPLLSERTPTLSQEVIANRDGSGPVILQSRYNFSLAVWRQKGGASMQYAVPTVGDVQANKLTSTAQGIVYAPNEAAARAFCTSTLGGLGLGTMIRTERKPNYQLGPNVDGSPGAQIFLSLDFTDTFVKTFAGNGLLETEVTEDVTYSQFRIVEKMLPDGPSILQNCGQTCGSRTVLARALGCTEAAGQAYVRAMRTGMLAVAGASPPPGAMEEPPRISTRFRFLEQAGGVPRGTGANPLLVEVNGQFGEKIPTLAFSP